MPCIETPTPMFAAPSHLPERIRPARYQPPVASIEKVLAVSSLLHSCAQEVAAQGLGLELGEAWGRGPGWEEGLLCWWRGEGQRGWGKGVGAGGRGEDIREEKVLEQLGAS